MCLALVQCSHNRVCPLQVAACEDAQRALCALRCLGGAALALLRLEAAASERGVARFMAAAPLLGIGPDESGSLIQPVRPPESPPSSTRMFSLCITREFGLRCKILTDPNLSLKAGATGHSLAPAFCYSTGRPALDMIGSPRDWIAGGRPCMQGHLTILGS